MKVAIVNGLWFIQIRPIPLSLCVCARMCVHTVMHPYIMYAFSFRKLVGFKRNCRNYKKKDSLKASQVIKNMKLWEGVAKLQSLKAIQKDSSYVHYFVLWVT